MKHYRVTLNLLYKLAIERGYVQSNPCAKLKIPQIVAIPPRFVSAKDIQKLFDSMSYGHSLPYRIMYYTGMRPSEVFRLKVKNIDLRAKTIDIYPDQTKTANRGIIPIHKKLMPIFKGILKHNSDCESYLFPSHSKEGRIVSWKKGLKLACEKAGVNITSYQFRHSFATHVLEKTGDLRAVQQLLRHKNIAMTTRYATALDKTLRDAVNKI